jgi:DNA-binding MarR family transcriptional regulator
LGSEEAGFVNIEKGDENRKPRTWVHVTKAGRRAAADHLAALQQMIDKVGEDKEGR